MKTLLTVSEVCTLSSLCRTKLYAEIKRGALAPTKIGRATRFHVDDVNDWINTLRAETNGLGPRVASQYRRP